MTEAPWPLEKQRRSRIDWHSLLDPAIADMQISYERRKTVLALYAEGHNYTAIAHLFGLTPSRISKMAKDGSRQPRAPAADSDLVGAGDIFDLIKKNVTARMRVPDKT
jgi:hypothetical protein